MGRKLRNPDESESKILLFNGLYYRGDWAQTFQNVAEKRAFNGVKDKKDAKFIVASSAFKYVEVPSQNLVAVEVPYKVS
jgi:serine protease inhibitor